MERKRRRQRDEEKTKLQTSWNNLSRQKERGQREAEEGSAINGPMNEALCAARQKKKKMLTL